MSSEEPATPRKAADLVKAAAQFHHWLGLLKERRLAMYPVLPTPPPRYEMVPGVGFQMTEAGRKDRADYQAKSSRHPADPMWDGEMEAFVDAAEEWLGTRWWLEAEEAQKYYETLGVSETPRKRIEALLVAAKDLWDSYRRSVAAFSANSQ